MKRLPGIEEFTRLLAQPGADSNRRLADAAIVMDHIRDLTTALEPVAKNAGLSATDLIHDLLVMVNIAAAARGISMEDFAAIQAAAEDAAETIVGVTNLFKGK